MGIVQKSSARRSITLHNKTSRILQAYSNEKYIGEKYIGQVNPGRYLTFGEYDSRYALEYNLKFVYRNANPATKVAKAEINEANLENHIDDEAIRRVFPNYIPISIGKLMSAYADECLQITENTGNATFSGTYKAKNGYSGAWKVTMFTIAEPSDKNFNLKVGDYLCDREDDSDSDDTHYRG